MTRTYKWCRIKKYLPYQTRQTFYHSFILPHMDYCSTLWGDASAAERIHKLQKRAARVITYSPSAKKLGHASLATVFRPSLLTCQPIPRENLESPVLRHQPITTAVITDACLNTIWHHGAYTLPKEDTRWLH